MSTALAERHHDRLERLADVTARRLTLAWSVLLTSPDAEAQWVQVARPVLHAVATQSILLSTAYARATAPAAPLGSVSPLTIPAAEALLWDPMTALWRRLGEGERYTDAVEHTTDDVAAMADDVALGTGRDATADLLAGYRTTWRRMLNTGACPWCMSMAQYEWPSAHEATFGHPRCRCTAIPAADLGDHNDQVATAAGWDEAAQRRYSKRHQIRRLRESEQNALKRSREAARALANEPDPDRRERLSQREQDWETRAERAAERRRILETGSHRLAA